MQIDKLKIRCSELGRLMSGKIGLSESDQKKLDKFRAKKEEGKQLTELQYKESEKILNKLANPELPSGAKTYIEELVERELYNFREEFETKQTQKGERCEIDSINFYNEVFFCSFEKNIEHFSNSFITGTPDVFNEEEVIDFKTSWTKKTFPKTKEKAYKSIYEWQLRGYMWLLNIDKAKLVYTLVDTPEDLCEYENDSLHVMKDLQDNQRFTILEFERDSEKEKEIIQRIHLAKEYALEYYQEILKSRP